MRAGWVPTAGGGGSPGGALLHVHTCEGKGVLVTVLWGSFSHSGACVMGGLASPGLDVSASWMLRDRYMKGCLHIKTTRMKYPRGFEPRAAPAHPRRPATGWDGGARLPGQAGWGPGCVGRRTLSSSSHRSHNVPSDQGAGPEAPRSLPWLGLV